MELKFLPSPPGAVAHVHHRGGDGPLCRLYHESLYPCATAEHEIKGRRSLNRRPFGILWITSTGSRPNPYSRRGSPAADLQ